MAILDDFINQIADNIASEAKNITPVRTANLRSDIRVWHSYNGLGVAYIGNTLAAPYAKFVHDGTKAHEIIAKNKKVLADKKLNKIYGKKVFHQGIKPNPYFQKATQKYLQSSDFKTLQKEFFAKFKITKKTKF